MKRCLYAAAIAGLLCFAGCSDNEDGPEIIIDPVMSTTGVYVVNAGVWNSSNSGTLSYLPLNENKIYNNVFFEATGQYVGDTFNDGIVTADKIYLAVNGSSVVHVLDRGTLKLEKTISFTGNTTGPRRLAQIEGDVYVTLFSGYLAKIDGKTLAVTSVEVGPNPEAVVVYDEKLYVAVSDALNSAGDYSGSCVAVVDPKTLTVTKRIDAGKNLTDLATNGAELFVLSSGEYEPVTWKQINYGVKQIKGDEASEILFPATYMAIRNETVYYIDNAYLVESTTYGKYDVKSGRTSAWIPATEVKSPAGLGIDVDYGEAYILSNNLGEGGYVDYTVSGYMVRYDSDGKFMGKYDVGVCPTRLFFARDYK